MKKKSFFNLVLIIFTLTLFACNKTQIIQKKLKDKSDEKIGHEINIGVVTELGDGVPRMANMLGRGAMEAANLYFEKINLAGGIYGRTIKTIPRHVSVDKLFKINEAVEDVLKEKDIFSFFWPHCMRQTKRISNQLKDTGIPVLFPLSGAFIKEENIFYIRPSYHDERETFLKNNFNKKMIGSKLAVITEKVDVCYLAKEIFLSGEETKNIKIDSDEYYNSIRVYKPQSTDLKSIQETDKIVQKLKKNKTKVLLFYVTAQGAYILRLLKKNNYNPVVVAFSLILAEEIVSIFNPGIKNFYFSTTFPIPSASHDLKAVQELEELMRGKGLSQKLTSAMLEGYIGAKLFVQVLKNTGVDLTRRKFIQELKLIKNQDFGGITIDFSKNGHQGNFAVYVYRYDDGKLSLISNSKNIFEGKTY